MKNRSIFHCVHRCSLTIFIILVRRCVVFLGESASEGLRARCDSQAYESLEFLLGGHWMYVACKLVVPTLYGMLSSSPCLMDEQGSLSVV
mmetsp:Transcript_42750/g.66605  ORF Transcript_42750/g.66605 Transcript_42750/m.66605 type:complete len:90 (+) Transcript_42750:51-320(+)